ncbi:hypothetical protein Tco_0129553 [Tanacetum coccineum]
MASSSSNSSSQNDGLGMNPGSTNVSFIVLNVQLVLPKPTPPLTPLGIVLVSTVSDSNDNLSDALMSYAFSGQSTTMDLNFILEDLMNKSMKKILKNWGELKWHNWHLMSYERQGSMFHLFKMGHLQVERQMVLKPKKACIGLVDDFGALWQKQGRDYKHGFMAFSDYEEFQQPEFKGYGPKASKSVCVDTSNEVKKTPDTPLVEELVSEKGKQTVFPTKIEFVKQQDKTARKPVKYAEMYRSQKPRGNQRNWNNLKSQQLGSDFVMYNKACFVCGSFDHVQAHCKYHQRERMVYGNNYNRVNYNYTTNRPHPNAQRNMVPRAVLMKNGLKPFNTARTVNTAHPKSTVYSAKPMSHFSKSAQSTVKRPYQSKTVLTNKNFSQKVNTAKVKVNTVRPKAVNTARPNSAVVNTVRANQANAIKTLGCWVWRPTKLDSASITLKKHNYIDARGRSNGCSRHMTGNISYLSDFKKFDGGYVTFGGGAHGGRISGKGTLKTDSLDFEDVYFVNELNFNLFSVSQIVDTKNYVPCLTDTDFDMKNIVPKESLTCLVAKATSDESML